MEKPQERDSLCRDCQVILNEVHWNNETRSGVCTVTTKLSWKQHIETSGEEMEYIRKNHYLIFKNLFYSE